MDKKALLIGGAGTIGQYVAKELLEMGCSVDIICLEDCVSDNGNLHYYKAKATNDYLRGFFEDRHYDAVLNLLHYPVVEDYIADFALIAPKTDHVIFVSSIRAVGDAQHPITETAPTLLDLYDSGDFPNPNYIQNDTYAIPKARCERYLKYVSKYRNWTIVRPMISSSDKRLDIVQYTFDEPVVWAREGRTMYIADHVRHKYAGIEWAGNTGKMIANLMFKPECFEKTYMLSTGHRMTWEDVANVYSELIGLKVEWMPKDEYRERFGSYRWPIEYDRACNREVDNAAILAATGLSPEDFTTFRDGIKSELIKLGAITQ